MRVHTKLLLFSVLGCNMMFASASCCPVLLADGAIGIGCYEYRHWDVTEQSHVIEVNGGGVLFIDGRLIIGYARVASLYCADPDDDIVARVGHAHIYLGAAAEREAQRMANEAVANAATTVETEGSCDH